MLHWQNLHQSNFLWLQGKEMAGLCAGFFLWHRFRMPLYPMPRNLNKSEKTALMRLVVGQRLEWVRDMVLDSHWKLKLSGWIS
jgi:hypothetical protein